MARKHKDQQRWKGEEVEPRPGDEAERAAERVEGNEPVRAEAEAERLRHPDLDSNERRRGSRAADDPEEQTAEAAEEHRDHQAAQGYPPRGKL